MAEMMSENVKQWIIKAESDITIAGKDLKTDNPVTDAICFHAQQAVKKYLKAYLVFKDIEPDKTHKIEKLWLACMTLDAAFSSLIKYVYINRICGGISLSVCVMRS